MSFAEELDASLAEDVLESHGGSSRVASEALATECIVVVKSSLAIRSSSTLEKGFSGIVPLRLTYHRDHAEFSSLPEMDFDSVRDQRERYRSQTELRDFRYGLYEIVHPSVFLLQVSEDTTYRYFVNEIVVSEGVWECQGNLVVFHDSCLGEAFSALVEDGYLVGSCFPGEFGAGKFRIIPQEEYDDFPFPLTPNKDYNPKIIHDRPQN